MSLVEELRELTYRTTIGLILDGLPAKLREAAQRGQSKLNVIRIGSSSMTNLKANEKEVKDWCIEQGLFVNVARVTQTVINGRWTEAWLEASW